MIFKEHTNGYGYLCVYAQTLTTFGGDIISYFLDKSLNFRACCIRTDRITTQKAKVWALFDPRTTAKVREDFVLESRTQKSAEMQDSGPSMVLCMWVKVPGRGELVRV